MKNISTGHTLIEPIIAVILALALVLLNHMNFLLFHCAIEMFSVFIGFGILLVAASLFQISKNHFFMVMGIGYSFTGLLDFFHCLSYSNMSIFANASFNLVVQFWIAARFLELMTIVVAICILYIKKPNYYLIALCFMIAFGFFMFDILVFQHFPDCSIATGPSSFKVKMEVFYAIGFFLSLILFYNTRKSIDKNLFLYLMVSLVCKIIAEIELASVNSCGAGTLLITHMLRYLSFYLMYKGVIVNGIQRPYEMLALDLKKIGKNLDLEIKLRSLMEEAVTKNQQCMDLFINKSSDGIIIEKGRNFIYVNSTAANILGTKDILNLYKTNSLCEDFRSLTFKQREEAMKNKATLPFVEYQVTACNGELIEIECSTSYFVYGGKPALLHMFRDISHKKKIQSLQNDIKNTELKLYQTNEFNRVLTEFFSNVSHELRTPLNIISSAVQLLRRNNEGEPEQKVNKLLNIMNQNTFRLLRIINNLIDVSKYDSGFLHLNLRNYNIVTMLENITLSVAEYASSKGLEIIFDTDTEEKFMAVDDDKIERIMLNLISNAIKFTNKGGQIIIYLEDREDHFTISVKDTGIGIPEDKLDLIFERFGQVDKSLKRNREGSGIGLSLVKTFVEMHGGTICVNREYKYGSEFVIDLPVKTVENNGESGYTIENKVEKIKIEFSDIYPDSLPLSS